MADPYLPPPWLTRSEEHTSELQSRRDLVCRLLLEKKNNMDSPDDLAEDENHPDDDLGNEGRGDGEHFGDDQDIADGRGRAGPAAADFFFLKARRPPRSTLFPYTPLFR